MSPRAKGPDHGRTPGEPAGDPTFSFEVVVVGGEEGAELRAAQARAIKELLEWRAAKRQQQGPNR